MDSRHDKSSQESLAEVAVLLELEGKVLSVPKQLSPIFSHFTSVIRPVFT